MDTVHNDEEGSATMNLPQVGAGDEWNGYAIENVVRWRQAQLRIDVERSRRLVEAIGGATAHASSISNGSGFWSGALRAARGRLRGPRRASA